MARTDDYENAKKLAVENLSTIAFETITSYSGFDPLEEDIFRVPFLNRIYQIDYPEFNFVSEDSHEIPIQEQVLLLHYMSGRPLSEFNKWVAYREIPGASFYFSAFVKRAIDPLKKVFGNQLKILKHTAKKLDATSVEYGDLGLEFPILPNITVRVIMWKGDDEFPPEANILFPDNINEILSPEDIAWLAGMLVYRLIALSRES
jgi:lipopolysaccharide biosynthesis glycosyltransferase